MTKPRTNLQNKSLHLLMRQYAEGLNDAGLTKRKVLELMQLDIPWTEHSVKEDLFNGLALAMFDKTSSYLDTQEIQEVYMVMDKNIAESTGFSLPWPDRFNSGDINAYRNR